MNELHRFNLNVVEVIRTGRRRTRPRLGRTTVLLIEKNDQR